MLCIPLWMSTLQECFRRWVGLDSTTKEIVSSVFAGTLSAPPDDR